MRKIKLLLLAVFALVGMGAFAAVFPEAGAQGYLYNEASGLFMTGKAVADAEKDEVEVKLVAKADVTASDIYNVWYKNASENNGQNIRFSTSATEPWLSLRYNNQKLVVRDNGFCKWGLSTAADGTFTLFYPSNYSAYGPTGYLTVDPKTKTFTSTAEPTPYSNWKFMTQEEFDALVVFPEAGAQGYLFNEASGLFMTGKAVADAEKDEVEVKLVAKADVTASDIYNVWYKNASENNGQNIRFSTSATEPWLSLRYNNQKLVVRDNGFCKWGLSTAADGTFTLFYPSNYSAYGPTGYLTVDPKTKTFTSTAEPTPYSNWKFLTQKQFEAIVVSIEEEPEKKFPDAGVEGYLYNPASGKFIDANGAPSVIGVKYAVYRKSTDNKDTDIRFGNPSDPANKHLRINDVNPVLQTNDPYYSKWGYEVKDDGKFLLKAGYDYDYGCKKGNYLTVKEDGTFEYVETANDASYWQFVDEETYQTLVSSKVYYLKNYESGQFFGGENNWGTRGTVSDRGDGYKLVKLDGGGYALQNILVSANDKNLGSNIYVDNAGAAGGWTINNTGNGVYTIYNTNPGYLAQGTEQLRKGFAAVALSDVADAAKWYILTKEEAVAQMTGATVDNPVPATFLIKNPGFNRNYSTADWSGGANSNGANENMNTEKYMTSFDVYQTLTGIPNGVYTLNAQASVTYHDDRAKKPYDGKGAPVIYANEETSDFVEMTVNDQLSSQGAISTAMNNGNYRVKTIIVEVTDGTLRVGAKSNRSDIWAVWDNFELAYLGTEVKAADLKKEIATEEYKSLIAAAREILPETMPAGVLVALDKAINDYTESKVLTPEATFESINAAVEALDKAYNNAKGAVDSSKALMAMYELMENNNVVTAEAYETYMGKFEAYSSQWEAGTLAEAVVNPYALNGWHNNSLDYDDYLLSAWSVGDNKCNNYDTELYINTWSVEGENDGTNFKVPFFEYWTGDDNSLGAKELVANLKDLEPGVYEVTAWVRARAKNGTDAADATGITFQVNDGDVVDVTEGETVGQFNIAEYVVEAVVEDGNLTVKFSVAGDNNISWLSFQNVKYTKTGDIISTAISEVGEKAAAKTVYNVAGQQLTAPVKGLNIVDGKKIYVK